MTEISCASFPEFDSEEIHNLPATEIVAGSGQTSNTTCFHASASQGEAMARQGSAAVPLHGDLPVDQGKTPGPPLCRRRVLARLVRLVRMRLGVLVLRPRHVVVGPSVGARLAPPLL